MLQSNSFYNLHESFDEIAVDILRGLHGKALDLRLSLLDGSIHVSYHLRIFDIVEAISRYDDLCEVVVVHLLGSCVSHFT